MKHFLFGCAAYLAAVIDTLPVGGPLRPEMIAMLSGVLIVILPSRSAFVWALTLGLTADLIGTAPVGTHAVCYAFAALAIHAALFGVQERPLHVACLAMLGFLTLATGMAILGGQVLAGTPAPPLNDMVLATAVTWLGGVILLSAYRGAVWCAARFRKPPAPGGAVGTPVGLSVQ